MKKSIKAIMLVILTLVISAVVYCLIMPNEGEISVEPPPRLYYENYEQFAQAVKNEEFFKDGLAVAGLDLVPSRKKTIQQTNIIKLKVDKENLAFDDEESERPVIVYWPCYNDYHGYMARHSYNGQFVFFQVWYSKLIPEQDRSPTLNYDAVINGENVRIHYQVDGERHSGYFDYKDGYFVLVLTYDKETFDYIFSHLSIEEISVK